MYCVWSSTVTREKLARRDIALLGRLMQGPRELGGLPYDGIERLTALGLATRVLGCCEITRAGQLNYHRHQYLRGAGGRSVRVAQKSPTFLQEAQYPAPLSRNQLFTFLSARRKKDNRVGQDTSLSEWLLNFVFETAHRIHGKKADATVTERQAPQT